MRTITMRLIRATAAAALLLAAGCSARATHTLTPGTSYTVPAGSCLPVAGPFALPGGASSDYTVLDDNGDTDSMNVGIIPDAAGCTFSSGFGVVYNRRRSPPASTTCRPTTTTWSSSATTRPA
jgi:hypothetical protein